MASITAGMLQPQRAAQPATVKPMDSQKGSMHTTPETKTSETVATGRKSRPVELVNGKMGRYHSSSSILFFLIATKWNKRMRILRDISLENNRRSLESHSLSRLQERLNTTSKESRLHCLSSFSGIFSNDTVEYLFDNNPILGVNFWVGFRNYSIVNHSNSWKN